MFYHEHNCAHTGPSPAGVECSTNQKRTRNRSERGDSQIATERAPAPRGEADLGSYGAVTTLPLCCGLPQHSATSEPETREPTHVENEEVSEEAGLGMSQGY